MGTDFITGVYNPDILSCIANLSSDEVFTPPEIANDMLDLLPQELFSNPKTTFFDPATKSGVFLREIAKRLIKGLENEIPDLQERIDHIFQKQLFGVAITELTSMLSRRAAYCSKYPNGDYSVSHFDNAEGNIRYKFSNHVWKGDRCICCGAPKRDPYNRGSNQENYAYEFIHVKNTKDLFNMKFDVIVSNPPYMITDGGGGSGKSSIPVYQKFVDEALSLNPHYLLMIIPSRWYSGGKGLDDFRYNMLNDRRISKLVDFADSKDCFSNGVDIPGGICYFLWQSDYNGPCEVSNIMKKGEVVKETRFLNEFDTFIRQNRSVSIVKKVLSSKEMMMDKIVLSRRPFGIESNVPFDTDGDYKLRSSSGTGLINSNKVSSGFEIVDKWKTIISKVTTEHAGVPDRNGQMKVLAVVETLGPKEVCSESYLVVGSFNNKEEAENLADYLRTKFVRFLMMQMLSSMNMTKATFTYVPTQDFTKEWSDQDLYKKYNLSSEEIELIEASMRSMERE